VLACTNGCVVKFMDYLKIGKATDLSGRDKRLYRLLEIFPAFLSWSTLLILLALSYFTPIFVAFFIIAFDVYWLLLVFYLAIHLLVSYYKMQKAKRTDWKKKCDSLEESVGRDNKTENTLLKYKFSYKDIYQLVVLPTYNEGIEIIRSSIMSIANDPYPKDKMVLVLAVEERGGESAIKNANLVQEEFASVFRDFRIVVHPDGIEGELKGKGANQAWAAQVIKRELIDEESWDYDKILVSIFDIDTIIRPGYFHNLTYIFLTTENPYRASYQPVPVYHNNIWEAPFFARVAAASNTFWQMMQQIRHDKLATYSSHSMTWRALSDIGFWSTKMVSEDSRIFWHCFCHYKGDYRVEPMYFPVSMDACMDKNMVTSFSSLYKQQRRWGWGVENLPYLMFNTIKDWDNIPRKKYINRILVQVYGFHSWATNALIIGVIGWMPILLGGDKFHSTVLSGNLPAVTRTLMTMALFGLVLSAVLSTILLPPDSKKKHFGHILFMLFQWVTLPIIIIVFGSVPGLEAQTRLMFGKYMGFWITPKSR